MEDDVYNGWLIPAGSTIIENTWYATGFCGTFDNQLSVEKGYFPQRIGVS